MSPEGGADRDAGRLLSLDVFRGLAVAAMILVNAPGPAPGPLFLEHMPWHGCSPADLIFPAFLFIVGAAVPFAYGRRLERGEDARALAAHAVRRAAGLFVVGLLLGIRPGGEAPLRLTGVLQRVAVCYLAAALLYLRARPRAVAWTAAALLGGYRLLLGGDLTPEGNVVSRVDRLVLGPFMAARTFDPEGLLSTLPAAATTLLGVLAGAWLLSERPPRERAAGLAAAGLAGVAAGLAWSRWLPLNKHLWTSSFALFASGVSALALAFLYRRLDLLGRRAGTGALAACGRHALPLFCASTAGEALLDALRAPLEGAPVTLRLWLRERLFGWAGTGKATLAWSAAWMLAWVGAGRAYEGLSSRRSRRARTSTRPSRARP